MEIIRQGHKKSDRVLEYECPDCESLFRFKVHEGTFHSDQRDGNCVEISCPVCGRKCYVGA